MLFRSKAMELLSKGFAMVPPRPDTAAPMPTATTTTTPGKPAVGNNTPTATDATPIDAATTQPAGQGKSSWGVFFIGLGVGCLLFLGGLVVVGMVMKRRSGTVRSKYHFRE